MTVKGVELEILQTTIRDREWTKTSAAGDDESDQESSRVFMPSLTTKNSYPTSQLMSLSCENLIS